MLCHPDLYDQNNTGPHVTANLEASHYQKLWFFSLPPPPSFQATRVYHFFIYIFFAPDQAVL